MNKRWQKDRYKFQNSIHWKKNLRKKWHYMIQALSSVSSFVWFLSSFCHCSTQKPQIIEWRFVFIGFWDDVIFTQDKVFFLTKITTKENHIDIELNFTCNDSHDRRISIFIILFWYFFLFLINVNKHFAFIIRLKMTSFWH
jgi:hypothetical protein